jgi:hypothetical protein
MVFNTIVDHSHSVRNPAVSLGAPSAGYGEGIKLHTVLQASGLVCHLAQKCWIESPS